MHLEVGGANRLSEEINFDYFSLERERIFFHLWNSRSALCLRATDVLVCQDDETCGPTPERSLAMHGSQQVVIEWRHYSSKLSRECQNILDYREQMLAATLSECNKVSSFNILPCVGYFHLPDKKRYGLVFSYPSSTTTPTTPNQRLADDYRRESRRDLQDRFKLESCLARSLYHFFTVRWLHKNIRSHSVLLFEDNDDQHRLPQAYLVGFGFSRREHPTETTGNLPSKVMAELLKDKERQLYIHPRRWAMIEKDRMANEEYRGQRSNMLFESYSLGVMLLEIGIWCPVIKICLKSMAVKDFQRTIVQVYKPKLRFYIGNKYAAVVRYCLESEFGECVEKNKEINVQLFLKAFKQFVVIELKRLDIS